MSKKMFRLASLLMVMMMVISLLVGCQSTDPTKDSANGTTVQPTTQAKDPAKKIKVVYTTMTLGAPYFVEVSNGLKAAGEKLGWDVQIHDAKGDVAGQIAAIENFIAQKVDLIYLSALDGNACKILVAKAAAAGIPTITEATIVEGTAAHVGPSEDNMGRALGEACGKWAKENLTGKVKVATFNVTQDPNTKARETGMREGFTTFYPKGDVEFIASLGGLTPEDGMKNFEGIYQANKDVNVFMGCNDDSIMGSYQAAKSANADLSKMCFGGVNAIPQALELMKDDKASGKGAYRVTVDITPFATGEVCIDVGNKILKGEKVESPVVIPAKAVTWDTIDEYFKK